MLDILPEGLHLALTPDEDPGIFDAQDICHVVFTDGGYEDPVDWQNSIVLRTCTALGITTAFDEMGEEITPAQFMDWYNGSYLTS